MSWTGGRPGGSQRSVARAVAAVVTGALVAPFTGGYVHAQDDGDPTTTQVEIAGPSGDGGPAFLTVDLATGQIKVVEGLAAGKLKTQCLGLPGTEEEFDMCLGSPRGEDFQSPVQKFVTGGAAAEAGLSWIADEAAVAVSSLYDVPNDYRVLRYARDEVRDYIVQRLLDILDKAAYGVELTDPEKASLKYLEQQIAVADATLAAATHDEYARYVANPCGYVPPPAPGWVTTPVGVPAGVVHVCNSSRFGFAAFFPPPLPSVEEFRAWGLYQAAEKLGLNALAHPEMRTITDGMLRAGFFIGGMSLATGLGAKAASMIGASTLLSHIVLKVLGMHSFAWTGASTGAIAGGAFVGIVLAALVIGALGIWDLVERGQTAAQIAGDLTAALTRLTDPFGLARFREANLGRDLEADQQSWVDDPAQLPPYRRDAWVSRFGELVARHTAVLPEGVVRPDSTDLWPDNETTEEDYRFRIGGQPVNAIEVPTGQGATATVRFDRGWVVVDDENGTPVPALTFEYLDPDGNRVLAARAPDGSGEFVLVPIGTAAGGSVPEPWTADHIEYRNPSGQVVQAFLVPPGAVPQVGLHPAVVGTFVPGRTHTLWPNPATPEGAFDPEAFVQDYTYTWSLRRFDPEAAAGAGAWVEVPLTPEPFQGNTTYGATFVPSTPGRYQAVVDVQGPAGNPLHSAAGQVDFTVEAPAIELVTLTLTDDPANGELDLAVVAEQTAPVVDMALEVQWPGQIGSDSRPVERHDLTQCGGTACAANLSYQVDVLTDLRHDVTVTVSNSYGSSTTATVPIVTPHRPGLAAPPPAAPDDPAVVDFDAHLTNVQLPVAVPGATRNHFLASIVAGDPLPGEEAADPALSLLDPVTGRPVPQFNVQPLLVDELGLGVLTASVIDGPDGPVVSLNANLTPAHVGSYQVPIIPAQFGRHTTMMLQLEVVAAPNDKFRAGIFSDDVDPLDIGVEDVPALVVDVVGGQAAWDPYQGQVCINHSTGGTTRELCDDFANFHDQAGNPLPFPYPTLFPHGLDAGRHEVGASLPDGERTFAAPIQLAFVMTSGPPVIHGLSWDAEQGTATMQALPAWPPGTDGPDLAEAACLLDGVEVAPCFDLQTGTWTPSGALAPGAHSLQVLLTNARGNYDTATLEFEVTGSTGPALTVEAKAGDQPYVAGQWSRVPVTVTFTCPPSTPAGSCPEPVTVNDTPPDGVLVQRAIPDGSGGTSTVQLLVKVDGTPPGLEPVVTPSSVTVGTPATAAAHATDPHSGVATESCDEPDTSTEGVFSVTCTATDVAGNTATGTALYTVVADGSGPAGPSITAQARSGGQEYVQGSWSRHAVQVRFSCESDVRITSCPRSVTVSNDTGPAGRLVTGTVKDKSGQSATVEFLVRVDRTPPKLKPVLTPDRVPVGGEATVTPNATDSGSGVASQSCETPSTTKKGKQSVWCEAVDRAGNKAKVKVTYTVVADDKPGKDKDGKGKDQDKDKGKDKGKDQGKDGKGKDQGKDKDKGKDKGKDGKGKDKASKGPRGPRSRGPIAV